MTTTQTFTAADVAALAELIRPHLSADWDLEAAACLYTLTRHADWHDAAVVKAVKADLFAQYGEPKLQLAMAECLTDSHDHHIPPALAAKVAAYAV